MVCSMVAVFSTMVFLCLPSTQAFDVEIISDLVPSQADERRALEIKADKFWQPLRKSSAFVHVDEHTALYNKVDTEIASMPTENSHVRDLLKDVLVRLKRADEKVRFQAMQVSDIASEEIVKGPGSGDSIFNFLTGGQDYFSVAIRRFVGLSRFSDRLTKQIQRRQNNILTALRGSATSTRDVLEDCRLASKLSFDVLKYDVYNKGVPKTPKAIKKLAYKLVDASDETRRHFLAIIEGASTSIAADVQGKHDNPSATVTQSLLSDMQPIHRWGSGASTGGSGIFIDV